VAAISAVFAISHVARLLAEDEDWPFDLSIICSRRTAAFASTALARTA
jgi:hypothetical protein